MEGKKGKRSEDSSIIMTQQMNPQDANPAGNVHGGVIMKFIDSAALAVAVRHARANAVTASIDRLEFHYPVFVGDLLTAHASLNFVGANLYGNWGSGGNRKSHDRKYSSYINCLSDLRSP